MMGGGSGAYALHWRGGAARCARSHIPGALSILKGAVPGRARGLGHMAPTYFRREPGIDTPTAIAARTFHPSASRASRACAAPTNNPTSSGLSDLDPIAQRKAELRREGRARREALPVDLQSA